jgi:hypothetical protein
MGRLRSPIQNNGKQKGLFGFGWNTHTPTSHKPKRTGEI